MGRVARAHRVKMAEGDKESDSEVVQEVAESDMSGVEADMEAGDNPIIKLRCPSRGRVIGHRPTALVERS